MNENTPVNPVVAIAGAAIIGVSVITIATMKHRIKELESTVRVKNGVIESMNRNFDLATKRLSTENLLRVMNDIAVDSKFERIILDI